MVMIEDTDMIMMMTMTMMMKYGAISDLLDVLHENELSLML